MSTEIKDQNPSDVIDVSSLTGNSEPINISAAANPFARQKPIHDDKYRGILKLPSNAEDAKKMLHRVQIKNGNNAGKFFYKVDFEEEVLEYFDPSKNSKELLGKQRTFSNTLSTLPRSIDGEETCEIARVLIKLGFSVEGPTAPEDLVRTFIEALGRKPQIGLVTEVSARYNSGEKKKAASGKEYDVWKTAYRGEKQFPKNPDGSVNYDIPPVHGNQVFVSSAVVDYFSVA